MGYARYRSYGRYRRRARKRDPGYEYALQHIEEARELSRRLGGTDEDVKRYFFALSGEERDSILKEYGRIYGAKAEAYARETFLRWQYGSVKMSGLVAGRLFSLLPKHMPLQNKYRLVERLWETYCPHSKLCLWIGPDADEAVLMKELRSHWEQTIQAYKVPDSLENRFRWLAQGDSLIYQQLLSHFVDQEKQLLLDGFQQRVPIFLRQLREAGDSVSALRQEIRVRKSVIVASFDPGVAGISRDPPLRSGRAVPPQTGKQGSGCLVCLLVVGFLLLLCALVSF